MIKLNVVNLNLKISNLYVNEASADINCEVSVLRDAMDTANVWFEIWVSSPGFQ